tara:strand:- start:503 stop:1786 length:1284 start_codon:yes stop_codon:yes gene_type:complete
MPIGKDHFFVKGGPALNFLPTYFGNESDGAPNFDGSATVAGISLGTSSYGRYFADGNPSSVVYPTPLKTGSYFYEATVQNKSGSYDGDAVLLQYSSLTIAANYVLTTDQPCRGMMVLVNGDCTINGSLSMTARGANKDPTAGGGASSGGIILPVLPSGSSGLSQSLSPGADFTGLGTAVEAIESEFPSSGTGALLNIPRIGMPEATENDSGDANFPHHNGNDADDYTVTSSWGSRATDVGKTGEGAAAMTKGASVRGGAGGCFSGGSGSGGRYGPSSGGNSYAPPYGAAGGNGYNGGDWSCSGGAGNPGGNETGGSYVAVDGGDGVGGQLILLVQGNLTIGSGGGIYARGVAGGSGQGGNSNRGGSSGGGTMIIGYGGTLSNSGTVDAEGGTCSTADNGGTASGKDPGYGGVPSGGDGSVQFINLNA